MYVVLIDASMHDPLSIQAYVHPCMRATSSRLPNHGKHWVESAFRSWRPTSWLQWEQHGRICGQYQLTSNGSGIRARIKSAELREFFRILDDGLGVDKMDIALRCRPCWVWWHNTSYPHLVPLGTTLFCSLFLFSPFCWNPLASFGNLENVRIDFFNKETLFTKALTQKVKGLWCFLQYSYTEWSTNWILIYMSIWLLLDFSRSVELSCYSWGWSCWEWSHCVCSSKVRGKIVESWRIWFAYAAVATRYVWVIWPTV